MRFSPLFRASIFLVGGLLGVRTLEAKKIGIKLPPEAYALSPEARARRALSRLAFGPRPGEVAALSVPGALEAWLNAQLYPGRLKDRDLERRLRALPAGIVDPDEIAEEFLKPFLEAQRKSAGGKPSAGKKIEGMNAADRDRSEFDTAAAADPKIRQLTEQWQRAQILRALYGERQLESVLGDFWFNHFNVNLNDGLVRFTIQDYERKAIREHVFDSFEELLDATAHHPAMLFYLENERSTRAPSAPGLAVQIRDPFYDPFDDWDTLHPVYFRDRYGNLHIAYVRGGFYDPFDSYGWDGWYSPRDRFAPGNSKSLDAMMTGPVDRYAHALLDLHTLGPGGYREQDVAETARIFTGWSIDAPAKGMGFRFIPPAHDADDARVLGVEYSGRNGEREGTDLLTALAAHPATAQHIANKFARHFAGDNPPASLVNRLAARFTASDGDLRQLAVALIESPEFWQASETGQRTPFEWAVSLLRATGAETDGRGPLQALVELGRAPGACPDPDGCPRDADKESGENGLKMRRELAARLVAGQWEGTKITSPPVPAE